MAYEDAVQHYCLLQEETISSVHSSCYAYMYA